MSTLSLATEGANLPFTIKPDTEVDFVIRLCPGHSEEVDFLGKIDRYRVIIKKADCFDYLTVEGDIESLDDQPYST